jgi:tetratricopeptide (TPR) repeat protein
VAKEPETTVHLYTYLELTLDTDLQAGLVAWERAFQSARQRWQLDEAKRLLALLKRYSLSASQRAAVRSFEGHLLAQQGAWRQAAAAYEQSLRLLPDHLDALSGLGNALRRLEGRAPEAIPHYQHALALADEAARPALLNNLGLAYYEAGRLDEAEEAWQTAVAAYQTNGDVEREANVHHNLGSLYWTRGQLPAAESAFTAALSVYEQRQQSHAQAETLNSLGLVREARGQWASAADAYRQALALLQQRGDAYGQMQALANLGNALTLLTDFDAADHCFASGLLLAHEMQEACLEGQLLTGLAELREAQGRWQEALSLFTQAIARKQAAGDERSLKHTCLSLAKLYHHRRQPQEATEMYQQALSLARGQQDRRVEAHALLGLAQMAHAQEQTPVLREYLEPARQIATEMGYAEILTETARIDGDLELLQPDPDYPRLIACYVEALAYARDFNEQTLNEMTEYLVDLLVAIAEDGQSQEAVQMAADIAAVGETVALPPHTLSSLRNLLTGLANQT